MSFLSSLLDPTSLLLGGVVLLCVLWWLSTRRPLGLPPGPGAALPLLGHLHLLPKDPRPQLWAWRRQYGDVFCLYAGSRLIVVISSHSAIHESLITFADVFSDRPHDFNMTQLIRSKGIIASMGTRWKEQRKTALEILRAMGMGKNVLAEKIQEEITHYIQAIKDHQGAPVDLAQITQISIANNIISMVIGTRFDYNDSELITCLKCFDDTVKAMGGAAILNYLPALGDIPGDPFKKQDAIAKTDAVFAFVEKHIAEHKKKLEEGGEVEGTDFIYSYLRQIEDKKTRGVETTVNEIGLQNSVSDLILGGSETTYRIVQWALLYFLHYPEVQDKCFKEISDVVGHHRQPSMTDKPKLTYVEATICEVLRKADIAPLPGPHATAEDVVFRGYFIPKGTAVWPFVSTVLHDPEIWGDPENFRPERFIGPDGKMTKPDEFYPFSLGRRVCIGESLARMSLFLYVATLVQHFRFLPAEEGQLPTLEGVFGITVNPHPYKIRAVPRI